MAIFKCKMCGGALEINNNETVAVCEYCGTKQTVSKSNDEVVSNLFNRANNLRLKCEFDKAEQVYEKILDIDNTDSEAHWGIVLCKYGIEYVEEPKAYSRIPTCHRTLYEALLTDVNYLSAIENADEEQKVLYITEAKIIDELQKNILSIVNNEKPFDVFICYKENDENGKRTIDSAITNDIYYQLTQEGFKVFYAPITLEDKLGREYEPYIFAALNSAKVMLVVGTKPEYFDSVWVRNEWSRFLKSMKIDRSKLIIPCYSNMNVYELPEEFVHLQAQDMSKIGFISDVIRGIKKIIESDTENKTIHKTIVSNESLAENTTALLKRGYIALEDGDFKKSDVLCEKVLDQDPENALAYLCKLMIELRVRRREDLANYNKSFENNKYYQKVIRFGDPELKSELLKYLKLINEKNEIKHKKQKAKREKISKLFIITVTIMLLVLIIGLLFTKAIIPEITYRAAVDAIKRKDYIAAYEKLESLGDYKNSVQLISDIHNDFNLQKIKKSNIGDSISVNGFYDWSVAYKEKNKVLLLCDHLYYCTGEIDNYNFSEGDINLIGGWEKSSLRTYLNDEFYRNEVPSFLQDYVIKETVNDNVFILSYSEYGQYNIFPTYPQIFRDVNKSGYPIMQGDGSVLRVTYNEIPENPSGTIKSSLLNEHIKKKKNNYEIRFANYRPAMWIDVSGIGQF